MSFYEDKIFPYFMEKATKTFRREIAELIAQAEGRVLEIGAGTGANLGFYSAAVMEVVGIEPVAAMLEKAQRVVQQTSHQELERQVGDTPVAVSLIKKCSTCRE